MSYIKGLKTGCLLIFPFCWVHWHYYRKSTNTDTKGKPIQVNDEDVHKIEHLIYIPKLVTYTL